VALWLQLQGVAQVVAAVRKGASGTAALDLVSRELRPGVQALVFHVWRNLGRAQALRKQLAPKAPPALIDALLCTALALAWNRDTLAYDAHTLVNQTVEAAKRSAPLARHAAFLNACLRRFLREQDHWVRQTDSELVARWNHPVWWIERLQQDHPEHWESILHAANMPPPMTLRVNVRKVSAQAYQKMLEDAGIASQLLGQAAIRLERPVPVAQLPRFLDGWVSVQDAAAQLAAPLLLSGLEAQRILDACAAPGGKTGHLLELSDGHVTAMEIDPARTARIQENLLRLGLQAQVLTADAAQPAQWWDGVAFDAILLDAPCSASGIVRRHPDVRWLRRESDIAQLAAQQDRLLAALWPLLKPGGNLLYCTCSVFVEEGRNRIESFLANNSGAVCMPSPGHLLPVPAEAQAGVDDNRHREDGFYYALLHKPVA